MEIIVKGLLCLGIVTGKEFMQMIPEEVLGILRNFIIIVLTQAFARIKSLECNLCLAFLELLRDKQSFVIIAKDSTQRLHVV